MLKKTWSSMLCEHTRKHSKIERPKVKDIVTCIENGDLKMTIEFKLLVALKYTMDPIDCVLSLTVS